MKKKVAKKGRLSATINPELLRRFEDFCVKNSINKSNKIERLIEQFLEEEQK